MDQEAFVKIAAEVRVLESVLKGVIAALPNREAAIASIESQLASIRSSAAVIRARSPGEEGAVQAGKEVEIEAQRWLRMLRN